MTTGNVMEPEEQLTTISLVLADRHPLTLNGLRQLFTAAEGFEILSVATQVDTAVDALRKHRPDVVVLDMLLPPNGGLTVLRQLRRDRLPTRPVLLADTVDERQLLDALRLGVRGVVLKEMSPDSLLTCVRKVRAGEQWLEKQAVGRLLNKLVRQEMGHRQMSRGLTPREIEIVRLAAEGMPTRQIAQRLVVTEGTVKVHLHNIYEKLQVEGRLGLALLARKQGLV
jgi:DNA-binding NarL/FixJ family response regulator